MSTVSIADYDVVDIARDCHAALAQDAPNPPEFYLGRILNLAWAYLTPEQRAEVEIYLAEKKYLPPAKLIL